MFLQSGREGCARAPSSRFAISEFRPPPQLSQFTTAGHSRSSTRWNIVGLIDAFVCPHTGRSMLCIGRSRVHTDQTEGWGAYLCNLAATDANSMSACQSRQKYGVFGNVRAETQKTMRLNAGRVCQGLPQCIQRAQRKGKSGGYIHAIISAG